MRNFKIYLAITVLGLGLIACKDNAVNKRKVISLDGEWNITETNSPSELPSDYNKTIVVPGLIDMAKPQSFDSIGYKTHKKRYFWYERI